MSCKERVPSEDMETVQEQLVEAEKEEQEQMQADFANEDFMTAHQLLVRYITSFSTEDLTDDKCVPILLAMKNASWSHVQ